MSPVNEDVWAEHDTNPDAIEAALRELVRERHAANQALAPARVLNLVVVVDRDWKGEIANRLERVGRYSASRTLLCAVEDGRETIDATAVMSYDDPKNGLGVMHEHVEIDIGPSHIPALDSIIDPVLASELPTVLWSPHGHDEAFEVLRERIDVMLLDSDDTPTAAGGLDRAVKDLESAYVVDLAWLRTTPWRERLAASFDPADRKSWLQRLSAVSVRHRSDSAASAVLLIGWLASRLGWTPRPLESLGWGGLRGTAEHDGGDVEILLETVDQESPGLAGVTVACASGFSLSLDRGRGGLTAREQGADGVDRTWRVMGASRGEAGILGEGVRQALLRDPTFGPALDAALAFCQS
jgi:glucose-6-phosphate dehydrogenase assembly protein OpcA